MYINKINADGRIYFGRIVDDGDNANIIILNENTGRTTTIT